MVDPVDQRSPWQRDDWESENRLPDEVPPSASGGMPGAGAQVASTRDAGWSTAPTGSPTPEPSVSRNQTIVAALIGAVLLVAGIVALADTDDGSSGEPVTSTDSVEVDLSAPDGTAGAPSTVEPIDTVEPEDAARPGDALAPVATVLLAEGLTVDAADVPDLVAGVEGQWAQAFIAVPPSLATIAPTEVVTLSGDGILRRIELPSGRVRVMDVSDVEGDPSMVIDDRTIVVYGATALYRITDGLPVTRTDVLEGVVFVQSRPGTGQFIVTAPTISDLDPTREWILQPDGRLDALSDGQLFDGPFWARTFSPTGEVLVNRPGGAYAISVDGATRRLSTGDLVATGARHYAVEECDEQLRCGFSVVDWSTGEIVTGGRTGDIRIGFLDPSARVSPDGRSVNYRDDSEAMGTRRVVDLGTGQGYDLGPPKRFVYQDSWAADGSGLFDERGGTVRYVSAATGEATPVVGFDVISLATRPAAVDVP